MDILKNLGINIVNISMEEALDLKLGRIELSLGKEIEYEDKLMKFKTDIKRAEIIGMPYSIHLPVYVEKWYPYGYFSAFFLDEDQNKRELSFKLLEYNLENLKGFSVDYYVLHFPGISSLWENNSEFSHVLNTSLNRVNNIAKNYGVKIYLEYFGSNKNFYDYKKWIEIIEGYDNLSILLDTGHLYFSSIKNNFDFMESLKILIPSSDAFHLWTTKGKQAYCDSTYYNEYHHIAPHIEQSIDDNWAFNTLDVVKMMIRENKPLIIEPSVRYGGKEYLIEGIRSITEAINI